MHIMRPNKNDKISAQFDMDHLRPNLLEKHGKLYALHQTVRFGKDSQTFCEFHVIPSEIFVDVNAISHYHLNEAASKYEVNSINLTRSQVSCSPF